MTSRVTSLVGNFGRLWRRGHESFDPSTRRILRVQGQGATSYLQGLVTCDLLQPPPPPREEEEEEEDNYDDANNNNQNNNNNLHSGQSTTTTTTTPMVEFSDELRAACFLDNKGRVVTDSLLWKISDDQYYIDVAGNVADSLFQHLKQFILRRSKVQVTDMTSTMQVHVVHGTLNAKGSPPGYRTAVDPRHPSLGLRVLSLDKRDPKQFETFMSSQFPPGPGSYHVIRKLAGVAEGNELTGKIALECNQEFLNAVSFQKGCYLGQELTARVQYKGAIRKRILPVVLLDVNMSVPRPWILASQIQEGRWVMDEYQQGKENQVEKDQNQQNRLMMMDGKPILPSNLPRLPRMSASAAGSLVAMMTNAGDGMMMMMTTTAATGASEQIPSAMSDKELNQARAQSEALISSLQTLKQGDAMIDSKDGKQIGQIIATAEEGTNVVLAQLRLDRVGLLGDGIWTYNNKVTVGDNNDRQFRFLPYLPLWWPEIDRESGKAKEVLEEDDEDHLD